jgi:phage terminase small subunit
VLKLTPKQKLFADFYIETANITEAYQRAYGRSSDVSRKNGGRIMANEGVKAYIAQKMAEKDNERILSQNEVLEFLSDVVKGKVTEQVPLVLGRDFKVIDKDPNIRDRVKAAELLGKRYALFTDRVEATQEVTIEWVEDDDDT